jgi:hypothetical protein
MPEDLYGPVWIKVIGLVRAGIFCCNAEIAEQYMHIEGAVGDCLREHIPTMLYEIGRPHWDWNGYVSHFNRMKVVYQAFISEYNGNRKNTVDVSDVSLVALAKTLCLPVVSMEGFDRGEGSAKKMRIPRLCDCEGVDHKTFNELLRTERVRF